MKLLYALLLPAVLWPQAGTTDWITRIRNKPLYDVREYNWFRTNGAGATGSLDASGAGKVITLRPCPDGLSTSRWARISGGSGTAESVQPTSVSCTAGASSGTITVTTVNAHSGSWQVASNTAGIDEATTAASAAGGGVAHMVPGTYLIYNHPIVPSNVILQGSGWSSIVKVADGQWPASQSEPKWTCTFDSNGSPANAACGLVTANGATNVLLTNFTFDDNGVNQTNNATWGSSVVLWNTVNSSIDHIRVINSKHLGQMVGLHHYEGYGNAVRNSRFTALGGTSGTCPGGVFVQTPSTITQNETRGTCDENFVANGGTDAYFINNIAYANPTAFSTAYHAENSSRTHFIDNRAFGPWDTAFSVGPVGGLPTIMREIHIRGGTVAPNSDGAPRLGVNITGDATHPVAGFSVSGMTVTGVSNGVIGHGISIGNFASNGMISGNILRDNTGQGIAVSASVTGMNINNNFIQDNDAGDFAFTLGSGTLSNNVTDGPANGMFLILATAPQIEIGSLTAAGAPTIDLHSSGNSIDFDSRLSPSGGTATAGLGNLTFTGDAFIMAGVNGSHGYFRNSSLAFASLGAPANGSQTYCTDCTIASPCAGAGSGAFAKRINGAWVCN